MTANEGSDLGHGVRVAVGACGELSVHSAELDLGWRPRTAAAPGSAVSWQGLGFEVVVREPWRRGHRWVLVPWQRDEVMRVVVPLDEAAVAAAARDADRERQAARLRPSMWALLPVLGLAPRHWQQRWRDEWGYPAALATWVSALLEAVIGVACMLQLVALVGGGTPVFGWLPLPFALVGVGLLPEALFRIVQVSADSEPVGSLVGLAAAVFARPTAPPPSPPPAPELSERAGDGGGLELRSPIQRRDWEAPGVLHYRDRSFVLEATDRLGGDWLYRFVPAAEPDPGAPRLRLLPPRTSARPAQPAALSGVTRTALVTAAVCLAPARFQRRWGAVTGARPGWFTALGAGAELVGGISNLGDHGELSPTGVVLGVFFVVEGALRLTSLVVAGRPMGSLLGLPLIPLLERFVPADDGRTRPPGRRRDRAKLRRCGDDSADSRRSRR
ncbi:MAG TPA: hypothetical protein VLB51_17335 [Methylomirabilota bacterium]|nr:hypothetical protein [Methylomirabilota bacterium]